MRLSDTIIAIILLSATCATSGLPDSTIVQLRYSPHAWMQTSYDDASFQTNNFHLLFRPLQSFFAIELDAYQYLTSKSKMESLLEDYTGGEQPFPFGLQSFRFKLHLRDFLEIRKWLKFNRIMLGNFHRNSSRYEYLNFSRYVLHSPLDIEKRRSLADWGIYSEVDLWNIAIESFLLHSFDSDYTAAFQARRALSISQALFLTPVVNGVFDRRSDANDNLAYPLGTDKTLSGSALIQLEINGYELSVKPLFAYNEHDFLNAESSRNGYLRSTEIILKTPPLLKLPDKSGIKLGLQFDGIIERNDPDYHPNFAYDSDELNDDFHRQLRLADESGLWSRPDSAQGAELPAFLYDREHVNVRLGETGGEAGIRLQGYHVEEKGAHRNVVNLGFKYARYSRTGETHAMSFDDSRLAELEFRSPDGHFEFNLAFWRRNTNIVRDPDLQELQVSTWVAGLSYILGRRALLRKQQPARKENTVLAIFFRKDDFAEFYKDATTKERGSIFMASLRTPLFRSQNFGIDLSVLYRKYVPDSHVLSRVFPPNNAIRGSVDLSYALPSF